MTKHYKKNVIRLMKKDFALLAIKDDIEIAFKITLGVMIGQKLYDVLREKNLLKGGC